MRKKLFIVYYNNVRKSNEQAKTNKVNFWMMKLFTQMSKQVFIPNQENPFLKM